MSKSEDKKEETKRRVGYIITNYKEARQIIHQSKRQLNDTSRELDEMIRRYGIVSRYYQVSTIPTSSFSQFQEANMGSLLVSGADNAAMAVGRAKEVERSIPHFSAVIASGSTIALSIADITRSMAESSEKTKELVVELNLPTPKMNQDALSSMLQKIEPRLATKLNGAWQTLSDRTKDDRFRQSSSSMRELISDALQVLAPDSQLRETQWFRQNDPARRPTQAERAYYAVVGSNTSIEPKDIKSAEDLAKSIRDSYEGLNKYTHERGNHAGVAPEEIENQLVSVFNQTQIYILEILRMRQKFFKK